MVENITDKQAEFSIGESFVKLAIIDNKNGPECWIYEIEGEGSVAASLMAKARSQAKEWGFSEVWANINNPHLAISLKDRGWTLEQVILKGQV